VNLRVVVASFAPMSHLGTNVNCHDVRYTPLRSRGISGSDTDIVKLPRITLSSWFIGKKFAFFRRKTPLLRLELFSF
jgi:hypothetical protein